MNEEDKTKAQQPGQLGNPAEDNKDGMLLDLLKRSTAVYNQIIQNKMLDANDIQKIDNVFLSLLILNERNYFENAIQRKELQKDKFESYIKMRHKFLLKQLEVMLKDLESKLIDSVNKKDQ